MVVYVSVCIPVTLDFDKTPSKSELTMAALENFLDHPAVREHDVEELTHYLDSLTQEVTGV